MFLFESSSRLASDVAQSPIRGVLWNSSWGVKRPDREADQSHTLTRTEWA
jgi:hypothetical protein